MRTIRLRSWLAALAAAALLVTADVAAIAAATGRWTPAAGRSAVSFVASFPLGDFTGQVPDVTGDVSLDPADLRQPISGSVSVRAASLRTGNDGRDRDMYRTLAVQQHPDIRFTLERLDPSFPSLTERADVLVTIHGIMSIRGIDRPMIVPGRARLRDGGIWVRGEASLNMSDFGIPRPSRFLLAVKDAVVISFDLTLVPR